MNLYHLRYFMVLAEMQHFRKASEKLCITQPSLSHAISQLESELGVSLFDRQSRSSVLTKEGRQFLDYVQRSLSILDDGVSVMQKASAKASSNLDSCVHWALLSCRKLPHPFWKLSRINPSNSNFSPESPALCWMA